jgi:predicted Zn-dependent peptidase
MRADNNFFRQVLPTGMTVIFEKRQLPLIAISAAVRFGSGFESDKLKGMAHFIEHSVFKGTKKRKRQQIAEEIEKKGGVINAYTDEEMTNFWVKLRSQHFDTGMDVISDIILNPLFPKKEVDMERKTILEEIKMFHDQPKYYVVQKLREQLFAPPFGLPALGNPKAISKMSRAVLTRYHNIYYAPSNIVISIVGDADVDRIWNNSKKFFAKGQVQKQIVQPVLAATPGNFEKIAEARKGIDQAHIALGFHVPSKSDKLRYAAEIFNSALGAGMSSKLFQEVREKKGLAYDIGSWLDQGKDFGYCFVLAGVPKGKHETVKKIILDEVSNFKNWNSKELDEAKEALIGLRELENERSEKVADNLLREQLIGDAKEYYKYNEKILQASLDDIRQVADIKNYAFIALVPEHGIKKKIEKTEKSETLTEHKEKEMK